MLTLAALASPAPAHAQNAERVEAVEWARAGDLDPAIARLRELRAQPIESCMEARYEKFRRMGSLGQAFIDDGSDAGPQLDGGRDQ